MTDHATEVMSAHPYPTANPVDRLRHTVSLFADVHGDRVAVLATSGVYPAAVTLDGRDQGQTGLTHGDLRTLLAIVDGAQ